MNEQIKYIDVSDLPAPEPLEKVLAFLSQSRQDDIICMIHRQNPCMLFDILKARGYSSNVVQDKDRYRIYIWNSMNTSAELLIKKDIGRVL